jgi:hypothetical protein
METLDYEGRERRKHRMFVTRNTEYHFREHTCIAVRDRRSGKWLPAHLALNRSLSGAIRFSNGTSLPALCDPGVGDALYFGDDGQELVTSLLCAIDRPEKEVVSAYPRSTAARRAAEMYSDSEL